MSNSQQRVSVIVADDHPLFRRGLLETLKRRPEIEVIDEASDGEQALALIREHLPDVAILDVQMPELSGLEVLNAVQRDKLGVKVMLLTGFKDSQPAYEAMALGAGAYLAKDNDIETVCDSIAAVARGQTVIGDEFQSGLVAEIRLREAGDRPALTDREREVLKLTSEGSSISAVAKQLQLSDATVKTHLHHVYEKLEVSDRAAAVARAMRWGLIE